MTAMTINRILMDVLDAPLILYLSVPVSLRMTGAMKRNQAKTAGEPLPCTACAFGRRLLSRAVLREIEIQTVDRRISMQSIDSPKRFWID
jgi:hypothetical protein